MFRISLSLSNELVHLKYGEQDGDHYEKYDPAHKHDNYRLQKGGQPGNGRLHFIVKGFGDLHQHILQLPAPLPY